MGMKPFGRYRLFLVCLFFVILFASHLDARTNNHNGQRKINDDHYYFEAIVPDNWFVERSKSDESLWRYSIYPRNKKILISA